MLTGKKILLRAIEESDLATLVRWRSDATAYDFFHEYGPISMAAQKEWFEAQRRTPAEINFAAALRDGTLIGTISLVGIDLRNGHAELGRVLIGEAAHRRKGHGREMVALAMEYGFDHLNLHKVFCEVLAANERATRLYREQGFVDEGILRQHVYKSGDYRDVRLLALFRETYRRGASHEARSAVAAPKVRRHGTTAK